MLIVVALLSIISVGAMTVLDPLGQIRKSEDARRKSDLAEIQKALEIHYNDLGSYPSSGATEGYKVTYLGVAKNWGTIFGPVNSPYMAKLPTDPSAKRRYVYYSTGQSYYLYANLERGKKDPQACLVSGNPGACPNVPGGVTCGVNPSDNIPCSYGVSSANVNP